MLSLSYILITEKSVKAIKKATKAVTVIKYDGFR